MVLGRCPSRSLTIVGDRAQARHGFPEPWEERLERVGMGRVALAPLTVNYRTPNEILAEAEPVIRAAVPDANVPTSATPASPSTTVTSQSSRAWLPDGSSTRRASPASSATQRSSRCPESAH
jgi:hypothetical protein